MTSIWIPITILATAIQTIRNGLFKHAQRKVSDDTILFVRFAFAVPFAVVVLLLLSASGYHMPTTPNAEFIFCVLGAAIIQIVGGFLFLALFKRRNFVIGVTYGKTEAIQAALFGALLFGEYVSTLALAAIFIGFVGILMISIVEQHISENLLSKIFTKSAQIGLACGACFGLAAVLIREAIILLEGSEFFVRAAYTMTSIFAVQAVMMFGFVLFRDGIKGVKQVALIKRDAVFIGFTTMACALAWFVAFSLAKAPYVSSVGQVEILFSVFMTHKIFKEKINRLEILGMTMLIVSIIMMGYAK